MHERDYVKFLIEYFIVKLIINYRSRLTKGFVACIYIYTHNEAIEIRTHHIFLKVINIISTQVNLNIISILHKQHRLRYKKSSFYMYYDRLL